MMAGIMLQVRPGTPSAIPSAVDTDLRELADDALVDRVLHVVAKADGSVVLVDRVVVRLAPQRRIDRDRLARDVAEVLAITRGEPRLCPRQEPVSDRGVRAFVVAQAIEHGACEWMRRTAVRGAQRRQAECFADARDLDRELGRAHPR